MCMYMQGLLIDWVKPISWRCMRVKNCMGNCLSLVELAQEMQFSFTDKLFWLFHIDLFLEVDCLFFDTSLGSEVKFQAGEDRATICSSFEHPSIFSMNSCTLASVPRNLTVSVTSWESHANHYLWLCITHGCHFFLI